VGCRRVPPLSAVLLSGTAQPWTELATGCRLQAGSGPQAVVLQPQAAGQGDSREWPLLTSGELAWHGSSTGGPGAAEGPQRPSVLTSETSDSVQIGDKGLEQSRTGEKKPHDSNVYSPA